jgi:hypothetical protein
LANVAISFIGAIRHACSGRKTRNPEGAMQLYAHSEWRGALLLHRGSYTILELAPIIRGVDDESIGANLQVGSE